MSNDYKIWIYINYKINFYYKITILFKKSFIIIKNYYLYSKIQMNLSKNEKIKILTAELQQLNTNFDIPID